INAAIPPQMFQSPWQQQLGPHGWASIGKEYDGPSLGQPFREAGKSVAKTSAEFSARGLDPGFLKDVLHTVGATIPMLVLRHPALIGLSAGLESMADNPDVERAVIEGVKSGAAVGLMGGAANIINETGMGALPKFAARASANVAIPAVVSGRAPTLQDLAFGAGYALMHGGPHDEQTIRQRAAKIQEVATHPDLHPDVGQSFRDIADGKFDASPPPPAAADTAGPGTASSAEEAQVVSPPATADPIASRIAEVDRELETVDPNSERAGRLLDTRQTLARQRGAAPDSAVGPQGSVLEPLRTEALDPDSMLGQARAIRTARLQQRASKISDELRYLRDVEGAGPDDPDVEELERERLGLAQEGEWTHGILNSLEHNPEWEQLPLITKRVILGLKQPEAEDAGPAGSQQPAEFGAVADQSKSPVDTTGGEQVQASYPSLDYEMRPGADPEESRRMAWDAVQDTRDAARNVRRIGAGDRPPGSPPYADKFEGLGISPEYIGSDIPEELIRNGRIDIRGQNVRNEQDLAALAQIFRDPRYETFRTIYVKDGRVVATDAISSRLPGASATFLSDARTEAFYRQISSAYGPDLNDWPADLRARYERLGDESLARAFYEISDRMRRLGADGYYLLHNHPTGSAEPSAADARSSSLHETNVKGYLGHVVIDSGEYGFIRPSSTLEIDDARTDALRHTQDPVQLRLQTADELAKRKTREVWALDRDSDPLHEASIPHPILGARAETPEQIANLGKQIATADGVTLLYLSNGRVRAIETVPEKLYLNTTALADHVRGRARLCGAQDIASYSQDTADLTDAAARLLRTGIIQDALAGGRNLRSEGVPYKESARRPPSYRAEGLHRER
ncbi:MAG TPA: hypothetical protein VN375_13085, partial [Vicinamibacteria bacterium]|nr:hypothetical protein [Vicinamibacteria bacterium]